MAYTDHARLMPGASGKTAHTDICRYVRKSVCVSVSMCVCSHVHVVPITVNWVNQLRTISGKMCRMWFQTSHVRSSVLPALRQLTLATRTHIYSLSLSLSLTHTHTHKHTRTHRSSSALQNDWQTDMLCERRGRAKTTRRRRRIHSYPIILWRAKMAMMSMPLGGGAIFLRPEVTSGVMLEGEAGSSLTVSAPLRLGERGNFKTCLPCCDV